jgi:DNA-binding NtrC family response regulator
MRDREAGRDRTEELTMGDRALGPVVLRIDSAEGSQLEPLAPGETRVLGASRACGVRLEDGAVSARHCSVHHEGHALALRDLGSRNGVWIGGARVAEASVGAFGSFVVGRTTVHVEPVARSGTPDEAPPLPALVGRSRPMRRLAASVRKVAPLRLPVLLRGESGTGKDLVARAIHDESRRANGPFVVINAATVSRELAESELFGHQRGAFTGAVRDRRGAFREAHKGTLFLDEIAALPLEVQAKLLRVVEEGRVRPLGGEASTDIDVRLVAATCEPLEAMVARGEFRADLYERLAVCVVPVPPLRDRPEDLPALAQHLLATSEIGERELSAGAEAVLRAHRFPGNVRELRNVLVQAAVRAGEIIEASHVQAVLADRVSVARRRIPPALALHFLEETGGNISAAARRADVPRSTLRDLLRAARASS